MWGMAIRWPPPWSLLPVIAPLCNLPSLTVAEPGDTLLTNKKRVWPKQQDVTPGWSYKPASPPCYMRSRFPPCLSALTSRMPGWRGPQDNWKELHPVRSHMRKPGSSFPRQASHQDCIPEWHPDRGPNYARGTSEDSWTTDSEMVITVVNIQCSGDLLFSNR